MAKNNETPGTPKIPKTPKKKGMIRTEAVVPVLIVFLLVFCYFKFFFDRNLKTAIEYVGTNVYGAEIDVAKVETSFIHLYFQMSGLEVTDKTYPQRNLVSVETIRFALLSDAILRMKMVVEDASILNIQVYTPRKHPGYIKPPPPPEKAGPSVVDDIEKKALQQAKSQYANNMLGDLANIAGGVDAKEQLKNIQGTLKSEAKIKEVEAMLNSKQNEWKDRFEKLPNKDQFEDLNKRAKALKFDTKNPIQFAKDLQDADKIIKEADEKIKTFKKTTDDLKTDVANMNNSIKEIDTLVKQDIDDLKTRFKIPSFDAKNFTQALFMSYLGDKLGGAQKYIAVAREYMPANNKNKPSDQDNKPLVPRKRGKGENVQFPVTIGYPLFWLKHAKVSSQANTSEFSGNVSGEIKNITTSPKAIGKPATIDLKGDFPRQQISGASANITLDHTTDHPKESFNLAVASYPFQGFKMLDSGDVKFNLAKAQGNFQFGGAIQDSQINLALKNVFSKAEFEIDAKQAMVKDILSRVGKGIPEVVLNASFSGTFDNYESRLNSNLGDALSEGFKKEIQATLDAKKKEIDEFVQNRIKGEKAKLTAQYDKIKSDIDSKIGGKEKEMQAEVNKAKADVSGQKKSGGAVPGGKDINKKLNDLKKTFGF